MRRDYIKNILSIFLLFAASVMVVNSVFNTHQHIVDGRVIVHAHPFKKDQAKHTHTSSSIADIQNSNTVIVQQPDVVLKPVDQPFSVIEILVKELTKIDFIFNNINGRAPPKKSYLS